MSLKQQKGCWLPGSVAMGQASVGQVAAYPVDKLSLGAAWPRMTHRAGCAVWEILCVFYFIFWCRHSVWMPFLCGFLVLFLLRLDTTVFTAILIIFTWHLELTYVRGCLTFLPMFPSCIIFSYSAVQFCVYFFGRCICVCVCEVRCVHWLKAEMFPRL